MASISAIIPQLFATASAWIVKFNGVVDGSFLEYVVNVMTACSGLGLVLAAVMMFTGPVSGASWGGAPIYTGRGRFSSSRYGANKPVFGTKLNPLPFRKMKWRFPWNINGLNVDGRITYDTKAWKPPNLLKSILKNGLIRGIIGHAKYRHGVKQLAPVNQAIGTIDKALGLNRPPVTTDQLLDAGISGAENHALDRAIADAQARGHGGGD